MIQSLVRYPIIFCLIAFCTGCAFRQPIPVGVVPEQPMMSEDDFEYGRNMLDQISQQYPLSRDDAKIERVQNIVDKLSKVVQGNKEPWNVYVFDAINVKNAAATQGNHIFVWTGMVDATRDDAELAAVLAHEMGHVLADHVRPSPMQSAVEATSQVGGSVAGSITSAYAGQAAGQLASMITQLLFKTTVLNPQSQREELEADQVGLFIMADAGYNPESAVRFWERARDDPDLSQMDGINFLSSHPSTQERFENLEKMLPQAEERFLRSGFKPSIRKGTTSRR